MDLCVPGIIVHQLPHTRNSALRHGIISAPHLLSPPWETQRAHNQPDSWGQCLLDLVSGHLLSSLRPLRLTPSSLWPAHVPGVLTPFEVGISASLPLAREKNP